MCDDGDVVFYGFSEADSGVDDERFSFDSVGEGVVDGG